MAGKYDLHIDQGATFERTFTWKGDDGNPVDLTGYTAQAHLRYKVGDATLALALASGDGLILGGPAGTIALTITSAQTEALKASGVWDLELSAPNGKVTRLLGGGFILSLEVTR